MFHTLTLTELRDVALTLIAVGTVAGAVWRMWLRPVVIWFRDAHEEDRRWRQRIDWEFENGVPAFLPDGSRNPAYVPLRHALDRHLTETKPMMAIFRQEHPDFRQNGDPPIGAI